MSPRRTDQPDRPGADPLSEAGRASSELTMTVPPESAEDMACFVISVAARLLNVHPQTLRYYERAGLIQPSRSRGNIRLYSTRDIERAQQIKRLVEDLGVNLAGVEVILRLTERLREQ